MENDFFPHNLKFLIDSGKIDVKTILKITGNTSPGLITMWKNGERQITTKDLVLIANYLNYTIDDLINKDLSIKDNKDSFDEYAVLFDKYKELSEADKELIKNIIETRRKQIDKELENKE